MDRRFMIILVGIVVLFFGIFFVNSKDSEKSTVEGKLTNHVSGKLDSKVTLVEYGDYQCNACKYYSTVFSEVRKKYEDRVKFQFRNYPIVSGHPNALVGAKAAEAAALQGKFWEMNELLYDQQDPSAQTGWVASNSPLTDYFVKYADQLKLDVEKFKADFASPEVHANINADIAEFNRLVPGRDKGTPTFFLNGKRLDLAGLSDSNGPSVEKFSELIDAELAKTEQ